MGWLKWVELIGGIYISGYTVVTVYLRAKDINLNRKSTETTYTEGFMWPLVVFMIPVWLIENCAQLVAKIMGYKDAKVRMDKLNKVS